ncbi:sigma-70 family RNA polymerase sigma factor [Nocardiopsis coralliicola]
MRSSRFADADPDTGESVEELIERLPRTGGEPESDDVKERIVRLSRPRAEREARRFRGKGVAAEELYQIAMLGVAKAIRGFDAEFGGSFYSYMLPTVSGEIKKHFRDYMWVVRVSRDQQTRRSEYNRFTLEYMQRHGKEPSQRAVSEHMGLSPREAGDMMNASAAYSPLSLDKPAEAASDEGIGALHERLGAPDAHLREVEDRRTVVAALRTLPDREQKVVALRFYAELSQAEIAPIVGCSQVHVSRLLARALSSLRACVAG